MKRTINKRQVGHLVNDNLYENKWMRESLTKHMGEELHIKPRVEIGKTFECHNSFSKQKCNADNAMGMGKQ